MTDLEQVEIQIDMANKLRALRDNCVKLTASETWKDVIDTGYFKEEAARLVMAKSSNLSAEQMKLIDNMQYGIGALANYIESVMRRGAEMDQALSEHEETQPIGRLFVERAENARLVRIAGMAFQHGLGLFPSIAPEIGLQQINHGPEMTAFLHIDLEDIAQIIHRWAGQPEQALLFD